MNHNHWDCTQWGRKSLPVCRSETSWCEGVGYHLLYRWGWPGPLQPQGLCAHTLVSVAPLGTGLKSGYRTLPLSVFASKSQKWVIQYILLVRCTMKLSKLTFIFLQYKTLLYWIIMKILNLEQRHTKFSTCVCKNAFRVIFSCCIAGHTLIGALVFRLQVRDGDFTTRDNDTVARDNDMFVSLP